MDSYIDMGDDFSGKFRIISQMVSNESGEYTARHIDIADLIMGSLDWEMKGLPPMGKDMRNVSLKGEDLSRDHQATKAKQAFLDMPREVLIKLSNEIYTIV